MKQVMIFQDFDNNDPNIAYANGATEANKWFQEHPEAQIIASHTNLQTTAEWTEYVLTLIVELPD